MRNAESYFNLLRRNKVNKKLTIDKYITNSLTPNDIEQLYKSNSIKYGIKLNYKI